MDLDGVYHELRMDGFPDWVGIKTNSGKQSFQKKQWSSDREILNRRTAQIAALRSVLDSAGPRDTLDNCFATIAAAESKAMEVVKPSNEFSEECYGQLLFRHDLLKPINQIPFFLIVLRFWKIYATPALAISMPLMAIIMPYILIRYVFGLPMPVSAYIDIIKKFYSGNGFKGLMPTPELAGQLSSVTAAAQSTDSMDFFGKLKFYGQTCWLIFSFAQTMWQPIQTAQHLAALDKTLTEQGAAIRQIYNAAHTIRNIYNSLGAGVGRLPFEAEEVAEDRMAVATVLDSPDRFKFLLKDIGDWELLYRLAIHPDICLVRWLKKPTMQIRNTFDIHVDVVRRITFSVKFDKKKHALLTGPNRGGKSTVLRSIGRSIWLAHNYGVAIGSAAAISPLKWMQTCLRLEDIPGSASLFEREVAVASLALNRAASGDNGLLLIDELFHSTNPPDAEIASREFLTKLWASNTTISVISTHMFQLLDTPDAPIQRLCCPAKYREDGTVEYKYGLAHGICNVSSVREILTEQGFYAPKKSG